jgi:ABC-type arginine/histidine transport system permease subunit
MDKKIITLDTLEYFQEKLKHIIKDSAYPEINHGTSDTVFTLSPNTFHIWDEITELTISLEPEIPSITNEYMFQFKSGSIATTLIISDNIKWMNDLIIEPNKIYQISILKGLASVLVFDN